MTLLKKSLIIATMLTSSLAWANDDYTSLDQTRTFKEEALKLLTALPCRHTFTEMGKITCVIGDTSFFKLDILAGKYGKLHSLTFTYEGKLVEGVWVGKEDAKYLTDVLVNHYMPSIDSISKRFFSYKKTNVADKLVTASGISTWKGKDYNQRTLTLTFK